MKRNKTENKEGKKAPAGKRTHHNEPKSNNPHTGNDGDGDNEGNDYEDFGSWHQEGRDEAHNDSVSSTNYLENKGRGKQNEQKEEKEEKQRKRKSSW